MPVNLNFNASVFPGKPVGVVEEVLRKHDFVPVPGVENIWVAACARQETVNMWENVAAVGYPLVAVLEVLDGLVKQVTVYSGDARILATVVGLLKDRLI